MHLQWLTPAWTWPVFVVVIAASVLWARRAYRGSVPTPPPAGRRLLVALRTAACLLILVALARPLLVRLQGVPETAEIAVVVEDSGSMALQADSDGPDRWRAAWRIAAAVDSSLSGQDSPPTVLALRGNGRLSLVETSIAAARADTPGAVGSDLAALVSQARQRMLGRPLRGMVVLTDGHSRPTAPAVGPAGVPLWLVGVGDVSGPADRFIADIRYPDSVYRGEPLTVEVAVGHRRGDGPTEEPVTVTLRHEGEVVAERTGPSADLSRWELVWTPDRPGLAVLEVEVSGLDNERFPTNNKATIAVDVRKDRARLLLLAAVPGWDVRFLAQAAAGEPRLALTVVRPGADGPVLADSLKTWLAPATAATWREDWDGVIAAGSPGALLPDAGASLAAAVRQGLGLCAIAGEPGRGGGPRAWPRHVLEVLPVEFLQGRLADGEYRLSVPATTPRHATLEGITRGEGATGALGDLPPLRRLQPVRTREGAEVLLNAGETRPLMVSGHPGQGRTLWFGGRRLWELAFWQRPLQGAVEHPGRKLLRQMMLWTALGDEAGGVSLLGQRLVYEEGEPLAVDVRWLDLRGEPVTDRPLTVEVARPDGAEARSYTLRPDPLRPGVFRSELPPLPPGRWRLTPRGGDEPPASEVAREIVVTRAERERAQVRQDRRNLRQTADRLAGTYIDAGRPDQLARLLDEVAGLDLAPRTSLRQDRYEPASGWPWLLLAVGLLTAEWLLRRRYGLL